MQLRWYQEELERQIYAAWSGGARVVVAQLATGGGKTPIFTKIQRDNQGLGIAVAHRRELVIQMSMTLARNEVRHAMIASPKVVRSAVALQMEKLGRSYYAPSANVICSSVDILSRMQPEPWMDRVNLYTGDEGHHWLRANKWGKSFGLFKYARGLLVTATPERSDGRGLGSHSDGIADALVCGPPMRQLILEGYLTDYRIFCPKSDIDLVNVEVGSTGDFKPEQLRAAARKSHIVGDTVDNYMRIIPGLKAIVFAVDVESATEIHARFLQFGVASEVVTAETDETIRENVMARFQRGDVKVLVNVDLFGEGTDVPSCHAVIMARPTNSYTLYSQQFGRALRTDYPEGWPLDTVEQRLAAIAASHKPCAYVIDQVGNVVRHNGPPDAHRIWSLDGIVRGQKKQGNPYRECPECTAPYERFLIECPYCGHYPEPAGRSTPEAVKGDLYELDPGVLALLRNDAQILAGAPMLQRGINQAAQLHYNKHHHISREANLSMQQAMKWYGGYWLHRHGASDREIQRRFYHDFGVDVLTAQGLRVKEATALEIEIRKKLTEYGIDGTTNSA